MEAKKEPHLTNQIDSARVLYNNFSDIIKLFQICWNKYISSDYPGLLVLTRALLTDINGLCAKFYENVENKSSGEQLFSTDKSKLEIMSKWLKLSGLELINEILEKIIKIVQLKTAPNTNQKSTAVNALQDKDHPTNSELKIIQQADMNYFEKHRQLLSNLDITISEEDEPFCHENRLDEELASLHVTYRDEYDETVLKCTKVTFNKLVANNIKEFSIAKLKKVNTTNRSENKVKGDLKNREQNLIKAVYNQVNEDYKTAENNVEKHQLIAKIINKIEFRKNNRLRNKNSIMNEIRNKMNQEEKKPVQAQQQE